MSATSSSSPESAVSRRHSKSRLSQHHLSQRVIAEERLEDRAIYFPQFQCWVECCADNVVYPKSIFGPGVILAEQTGYKFLMLPNADGAVRVTPGAAYGVVKMFAEEKRSRKQKRRREDECT